MRPSQRLARIALRVCALCAVLFGVATNAAFAQGTYFLSGPEGVNQPHVFPTSDADQGTAGADGGNPYSGLVLGRDGNLYGTTYGGGTSDNGTIFMVNGTTGKFRSLYSFTAGADGQWPVAGLIQGQPGDDAFYGMTYFGGTGGFGVIFRCRVTGAPGSEACTTDALYSFHGDVDGGNPIANLVQASDGSLWGVTAYEGAFQGGTIFKCTVTVSNTCLEVDGTGLLHTLYAFTGGADGANPQGALLQGLDGSFYGTTWGGGVADNGTVFKFNPTTSTFTLLYEFSGGADGGQLFGNLVQTSDGSLWGTTFSGGLTLTLPDAGNATIFKCTLTGPANGQTCAVDGITGRLPAYEFSGGLDGRKPNAGLFASSDGSLYAPTWFGSGSNAGTIVKCTPASSSGHGPCAVGSNNLLPTVYTFGIIDGDGPNGLTQTSDGSFWGTTSYGGAGFGTIFRLAPLPAVSLSGPIAVVVNTTSPAGTLVTLSGTVSDPANPNITNPATTVTWTIDGNIVHTDSFSVGPLTAVPISLAVTYPAGTHSVTIAAKDTAATTDTAVTTYSVTVEVDKLNQTVTFAQPANLAFSNPAPTLTLAPTASSTLPVSLSVSGPATLAGNVLTITGAGTVTVTASQAGDGQYNPATDQVRSFTIAKGTQTITFAQPAAQVFGNGLALPLPATSTSGLAVTLTLTSTAPAGIATLTNNVLTVSGVGSIVVTATQAGDNNFNAAANTGLARTITVAKGPQTITFATLGPLTFGTSPLSLGAAASSGLAVTYAVASGPGTVSGSTLTITGVGTIVLNASQAGNTNFNAATTVQQSIVVSKANQTITFNAVAPQTPGTTVGLVATSTSGLPVTLTLLSGSGSLSGSTLTSNATGTIVVKASQAGNANYNAAADVLQNITVGQAPQTIAFTTVPAQTFGGPLVTLVATATSGLPVTFAVTSGPGTVSGNQLTTTGVGTIVVTASQAGNASYNAAPVVPQSIVVGKANQTITFSPTAAPAVGGPAVTLVATATSGLPVTFSFVSGPGTVSDNQLTATGFGTIIVTASQAGNANYNAATNVTQNIAVAKTNQTITFPAVSSPTFGAASVPLAATASSALPVTYTIVSGPGSVSGSTLTLTGTGTIVVKASQAGNGSYNAAPDVSQSITVNKATLTVTTVSASRNYGLANPAFTASYAGFVAGNGPTSLTGTLTFTTTATSTSLPGAYPVTPGGVTSANYTITFVAGTLTVLDIPPVAANDVATTATGTAVTISVLANDAHALGTLTITAVATPAHGTAAISGTSIVYTPAAGYVGADSFTYTENDGFGGTSTGTVSLTVGTAVSALGKFVAFSRDLTWLHAGATVTTGDIGANLSRGHDDGDGHDGHHYGDDDGHDHWSGNGHGDDDDDDSVTVRLDANAVMQQTTSRVVGDTVELAAHSSIYGLVKNSLVNHGGAILGTTVNTMAVPYLTLPVFPSLSAGTASVNVTRNATQTLAPGRYGTIHVESGGKLILTGGLYQIISLDVDQSATVLFRAAVDLRIATSLNADTSSQIITDPTVSGLKASQIKIYVASADDDGGCHNRYQDSSDNQFGGEVAVNIGQSAIVKANIYAPNGTVWLKSGAQGTGAFIGEHVQVGPGAKLTLDSAF